MVPNEKDQDLNRSYLLGVLGESETQDLEQRLLTDEGFSEELQIAEDELVDDYLAERLTPDERVHFETHFLAAPERQQDLHFSRVFRHYLADASLTPILEKKESPNKPDSGDGLSFRSPWKQPAFVYTVAALCLLSLTIGGWWILSPKRPTIGREQIEQELARLNEREPTGQSTTVSSSEIYRARLTPGRVRSEGSTKKLQISPQSNRIEIELEVPAGDYVTYQATLMSDGAELYSVPNLAATPESGIKIVRLYLLPKYLPSGDYQLKLSGKSSDGKTENVESYLFRVVIQ